MPGPGFVRSLHTPSVTGGSFVTPGHHSNPGPMGERGGLASFLPKTWHGHRPGWPGRGTATIPHIQARFLHPRVPGAAVSAPPRSLLHSKLSRERCSAPLGSTETSAASRVPPAHPAGACPSRAGGSGARQGGMAGSAPRHCRDRHPGLHCPPCWHRGSGSTPRTAQHPKEG